MNTPGEDAEQGKSATPTETTRSTTIWWIGLAAALGVAVIFVLLRVGYVNRWVIAADYTPAQLAAAGGWVSGIGSLAAVTVAVLSARHSQNEAKLAREERDTQVKEEKRTSQARMDVERERHEEQMAATKRQLEVLEEENNRRWAEEERQTQYNAFRAIFLAVANIRATVAAMVDLSEDNTEQLKPFENEDGEIDNDVLPYVTVPAYYIHEKRRESQHIISESLMTIVTESMKFTIPDLITITNQLKVAVADLVSTLNPGTGTADWEGALEHANKANALLIDLQLVATQVLARPS